MDLADVRGPDFRAAAERLRTTSHMDLGLFGVVPLTCMTLMRFT